jgi:hypothetical protein
MSSCKFESGHLIIDENGLDERTRSLVEFAADLATPFCNYSNPAKPDADGRIERPITPDVSLGFREKLAELATGDLTVAS